MDNNLTISFIHVKNTSNQQTNYYFKIKKLTIR